MSEPVVYDIPGGYRFIWEAERLQARVTRFVDERRSMSTSCEVIISSTGVEVTEHLHQARLNLTSTVGRRDLAKALTALDGSMRWSDLIESLCVNALALHRQGQPMVSVGTRDVSDAPRYLLRPLLVEGEANMIYGDGGTFKSYLGLLIALLVQSGEPAFGLQPKQGNVLYLDWETRDTTVNARLRALSVGLERAPIAIQYRRCYATLSDDVEALQQMVYDANISLVIVDSVGAAVAEELKEAESASSMYNALRTLRTTSLLITHVPKALPGQTSSNPYGSVYFRNYTRNAWEIRKIQEAGSDGISLGLFNRKNNDGKLFDDIGLEIRFETGRNDLTTCVRIKRGNVKVGSTGEIDQGDAARILERLTLGYATDDELSSQLNIKVQTVQARLSGLKAAGKVTKDSDGYWNRV